MLSLAQGAQTLLQAVEPFPFIQIAVMAALKDFDRPITIITRTG